MAKLKGFVEGRRYRTRYWNNGDNFCRTTDWGGDVDESYEVYRKLSSKYDNAEWIEEITHGLSGRGTEATDCAPRWAYDPSTDTIVSK